MAPQKPLVVVGSVNADLVVDVPRMPKPGETLSATGGGEVVPGGKGANQACAGGMLGYQTIMIGQVGTDAHGPSLKGALDSAGVETDLVTAVDGPSGQAVIYLAPDGENSIVIIGGANQAWGALSRAATEAIQSAGALLLQREVPPSVNIAAARAAKAAGVPVIVDAGGAEGALEPELLECTTILSPNETELARLVGKEAVAVGGDDDESLAEVLEAARSLQAKGAEQVLVKLGSRGSYLVPAAGGGEGEEEEPLPIRQSAIPAPEVVDTTAAGDSFTGAYAVALLEGKPPREALRFAAAAGSLCVRKRGAIPSLPSRAEVDQLLLSIA